MTATTGLTEATVGQDWDAVRLPLLLATTAVGILGRRCGAVLADEDAAIFLVPQGAAAQWTSADTAPLQRGSRLTLPPARRTEGAALRWMVCPSGRPWANDCACRSLGGRRRCSHPAADHTRRAAATGHRVRLVRRAPRHRDCRGPRRAP